MPTATFVSGYSVINNGPLTTTFTAPASCSTAYNTLIGLKSVGYAPQWAAQCVYTAPADCNPSGSALNSIISAADSGSNPASENFIVYHSPGLVCPSGWATVGEASKPNPTSVSVSGAFNESSLIPTQTPNNYPFLEPYLDIVIGALDPSETAIVCCPSSYSTGDGACYSTLSSFAVTPTAGCARLGSAHDESAIFGTYTIAGETITGELYSLLATGTAPIVTSMTTFSPAQATELGGMAAQDMFILIHQASDTSTAASPSKTGAAVSVRGNVNGLGVIATVYCFALALTALLVL